MIVTSTRLRNTAKEALSDFVAEEELPQLHPQIPYEQFLLTSGNTDSPERSICGRDYYISETDRSVLILHSSGTTGLPKPIYTSHTHLLCFTVCHDFKDEEEIRGLNVSTLPLYHVSPISRLQNPTINLFIRALDSLPHAYP